MLYEPVRPTLCNVPHSPRDAHRYSSPAATGGLEGGRCMQQVVAMDEEVLRYFDVDVRAISQNPPDHGGDVELGSDRYADEWGVVRRKPAGCHYYELERSPLCGEITPQDIARHAWPDPGDPGRYRGLREQARRLREETDFAVMYNARFHPVHLTQYLRGFQDWYLDLGGDQDLFSCLWHVATHANAVQKQARVWVGKRLWSQPAKRFRPGLVSGVQRI